MSFHHLCEVTQIHKFIEIGPTSNNGLPPLVQGDPNTLILPENEKGCKMSSSCLEMAHFLHVKKNLKQLINSNSLMAVYVDSLLHDKLFIQYS